MHVLAEDTSSQVAAVKVVVATVIMALVCYQVLLALALYRRLPGAVLARRVAARGHRILGTVAALTALGVAVTCVASYDVGDALEDGGRSAVHVVAGSAVLLLLLVKVGVVHGSRRAGRLLPFLGAGVAALFVVIWATSAAGMLA